MGNPIDGDKGVKYGKANGASRNGNEENIETAPVIWAVTLAEVSFTLRSALAANLYGFNTK